LALLLPFDPHDNLVFAASSGGNASSKGPTLPTFFVLELARKCSVVAATMAANDRERR
jgi:hypothetical protein